MIKVKRNLSFMAAHVIDIVSLSQKEKNIMLMSPWYHLLEGKKVVYSIMKTFKTTSLAFRWVKLILPSERDDIAVALIHI